MASRARTWARFLTLALCVALPAGAAGSLGAVGQSSAAVVPAAASVASSVAQVGSATPAARRELTDVRKVSAGGEFSCGIRPDRTLWCWGRNTNGQLGLGRTGPYAVPPTQVGTDADWKQVSAGGASACGVRATGALYCWGLNHRGQLGDETKKERIRPQQVTGSTKWARVSSGWFHTCAVRTNGAMWCWGDNSSGQLGQGNLKQAVKRVRVSGKQWKSVSAGGWTTCATKDDRSLWCWGRNIFGQLGTGSLADRSKPARVGEGTSWKQVAVSWTHTCGVLRNGTTRCWGRNNQGQLGNGRTTTSSRPVTVAGGHEARSVAVSEGTSCLVDKGRSLWCWGGNAYGQIGGVGAGTPAPVRRTGAFTSISGGWLHMCAGSGDGAVCWGNNERGQLGDSEGAVTPPTPTRPAPKRTASARKSSFGFKLATFNVLGNIHSRPYAHDDRFGPSRIRAEWTAQALLTGGIQVAGLQEPDAAQVAAIVAAGQGNLEAFPAASAGDLAVESSLVWDTRVFEATKKTTIRTQFIRRVLERPVVRLRHIATGRQIWVMSVHNAPFDYQAKRDAAVKVQLEKVNELEETGLPVFYVGDMNEKKTILCKVLRRTDMDSPIGGGLTKNNQCRIPKERMRVDWIFGSKSVQWSGFTNSKPPLVRLSTDHWVPVVNVQVP